MVDKDWKKAWKIMLKLQYCYWKVLHGINALRYELEVKLGSEFIYMHSVCLVETVYVYLLSYSVEAGALK